MAENCIFAKKTHKKLLRRKLARALILPVTNNLGSKALVAAEILAESHG